MIPTAIPQLWSGSWSPSRLFWCWTRVNEALIQSSARWMELWSSGWTWVQGPLGVGSGWSGVWDSPASPNHLRRGGGGVVMPSRVVRWIGFLSSTNEKGTFSNLKLSHRGKPVSNKLLVEHWLWYRTMIFQPRKRIVNWKTIPYGDNESITFTSKP